MTIERWLKTRAIILLAILLGSLVARADDFPPRPNPPRLVNDLANILTPGQQQALEDKLVAYNDSTSTQIAIVTLHSVGINDIGEYTINLGDKWGIGQKGKDNGILILVAMDDHKDFIATGRGAEITVTDVVTRRVREGYLEPNFKKGNYYEGLDQSVDALFKVLTGQYKADDLKHRSNENPIWVWIFLIIAILIIISNIINRFGGGYRGYRSSGPYMGGGWIGGGSWGGGSSGGGGSFGGFGGGSFGGGGSGGSW